MRKQTKLVAVLSATALLAIGASAAAFAAGWNNDSGSWQWIGNDGVAVTNEWKKSGNDWFYLGDDGNMVTDSIIEDDSDYYYVNEAGAMVANQWVSRDNDDDFGDAEYVWYYFGNDGKAYKNDSEYITKSKIKTINGKKYTFNAEGKMLYGWLNKEGVELKTEDEDWKDAVYYFGDWTDGSAQSGWRKLSVTDGDDTEEYWFYFNSNGEKKKNAQTIEGKKYVFAADGHMLDDWANASDNVSSNIATDNAVYLNGDGSKRTKTWIWAVPSDDFSAEALKEDNANDEYSWFYTDASGNLETDKIKKINGKSYAFDKYGRMQTKLVAVAAGEKTGVVTGLKLSDSDKVKDFTDYEADDYADDILRGYDIYYFSDDEEGDGAMKKGYQNVEFDDDTYQMYFDASNGKAKNDYVKKISKYCANGLILKANRDTNLYAGVSVVDDNDYKTVESGKLSYFDSVIKNSADKTGAAPSGTYVLVNTAGTVQKNKTNLKDSDDRYFLTDSNGIVKWISNKKLTTTVDKSASAPVVTLGDKNYYYVVED